MTQTEQSKLDIDFYGIPLLRLKEWVDTQIKNNKEKMVLEIQHTMHDDEDNSYFLTAK